MERSVHLKLLWLLPLLLAQEKWSIQRHPLREYIRFTKLGQRFTDNCSNWLVCCYEEVTLEPELFSLPVE